MGFSQISDLMGFCQISLRRPKLIASSRLLLLLEQIAMQLAVFSLPLRQEGE